MNRRRFCRLACAVAVALPAASVAIPALAQQQSDSGQLDPVPVMIWTIVAFAIAMLVLSLGYLYRRARGEPDENIPKNVEPYYSVEGQIDAHITGELHPEMAHDAVGLDAAQRSHGETETPTPSAPH